MPNEPIDPTNPTNTPESVEPPPGPRIVQGVAALARLEELGIPLEVCDRVRIEAATQLDGAPPLGPVTGAGLLRWIFCAATMRDGMIVLGWEPVDVSGSPQAISADGTMALVVAAGDNVTGLVGYGSPHTNNPVGATIGNAIIANAQQAFPGMELPDNVRPIRPMRSSSTTARTLLVLLVFVAKEEIRGEVSTPIPGDGDEVVAWRERIILPRLPRDTPTVLRVSDENAATAIEVTVTRKS